MGGNGFCTGKGWGVMVSVQGKGSELKTFMLTMLSAARVVQNPSTGHYKGGFITQLSFNHCDGRSLRDDIWKDVR